MELQRKKIQFLAEEGAALLVEPAARAIPPMPATAATAEHCSSSRRAMPGALRCPCRVRLAAESPPTTRTRPRSFPRSSWPRSTTTGSSGCASGEKLKMVVDLSVQFHDDDLMAYNTVAEIPGTDLKDELVMLGGHMDSWHSGTGATDNGAGVSVAMEAVRILQALELEAPPDHPHRALERRGRGTLGFARFRQGTFGGARQQHVRAAAARRSRRPPATAMAIGASTDSSDSAPKPEYDKFSAYFNLDNGTGKIRGVYMQGNESVRPIFRKWLQPFREMGATTLTISNTGGTDHQSFDGIGLPGFQFIQDEIEYDTRTHHSNQDVFDRIQADDMKQAAVIMAAFVYNAATIDQKLPRKPAPQYGIDDRRRTPSGAAGPRDPLSHRK